MIKNSLFGFDLIRFYLWKTEIQRLLFAPVMFGFLLLLARTIYTGQLTFLFLVWNLFLAFVPYFLSYTLTHRSSWIENKRKFALVFTVWLLFIPNSFYVITDLFHLYDSSEMPRWYDLLLIFCFAWNALLLGIMSVRHMEKILQGVWPRCPAWLLVFPIMLLNAAGIYIGRVLRYNSWDILVNPFHLLADSFHILMHPLQYKDAWAMVWVFSFFLSMIYITLKKLSRSFH